jgi:3'-phosphoadenosine 5'-phosphosulfate sulfotransferase (PAPS reductase)/FAD synthetase
MPIDRRLVVAFSGGKDSTAMALQLHKLGHKFELLHTSTGNELPDVKDHINKIIEMTGAPFVNIEAPTLEELIEEQQCLPNWRMRWCTRMIKIEPVIKWLSKNKDKIVLAVGLRADEPGRAGGTYNCEVVYPLREWDWGIVEVKECINHYNITIPRRTDCAVCFYQTLYEWRLLWKEYPKEYERGEMWEKQIGHTFRSPTKDKYPASLKDLRQRFENGWIPQRRERKAKCRICSNGGIDIASEVE